MYIENFKTFFEIFQLSSTFIYELIDDNFIAFYSHPKFNVIGNGRTKDSAKIECCKQIVKYLMKLPNYKTDFTNFLYDTNFMTSPSRLRFIFLEKTTKLGLRVVFKNDISNNDNKKYTIQVDGITFNSYEDKTIDAESIALITAICGIQTIYGNVNTFFDLTKYKDLFSGPFYIKALYLICDKMAWSINYHVEKNNFETFFKSHCLIEKKDLTEFSIEDTENPPDVDGIYGYGQKKKDAEGNCAKQICLRKFKNANVQFFICQFKNELQHFINTNYPKEVLNFYNPVQINTEPPIFEAKCVLKSLTTVGIGKNGKEALQLAAFKMLVILKTS
ncbi:Double-stranded RNA-binding domain-containing protein [Strongyloides ratti]|uniref:Double-stranded RNA-binding domain-containing protein n=1 Tax=Strongyloides ratti TaxID=34506 RepID=A0A090L7M2_STRRB|nr:Double-stranded RNA-binding domain-containing protein [Strongyloides ratti]CEF65791.1 Double-stranded RNA-binding domain-containing protein [Strongyloides ratti]